MIGLLQQKRRFIGKCNAMVGFTMFKDTYAAIPYGKQYLILHNGQQLDKLCRTEASARKYITDHKKGKSQAKLPVN